MAHTPGIEWTFGPELQGEVIHFVTNDACSKEILCKVRINQPVPVDTLCTLTVRLHGVEYAQSSKGALHSYLSTLQGRAMTFKTAADSGEPLLACMKFDGHDFAEFLLQQGLAKVDDPSRFSSGGFSQSSHGNSYHKLLAEAIVIASPQLNGFKLKIEYRLGGKLDDLAISYDGNENNNVNIFLQVKHQMEISTIVLPTVPMKMFFKNGRFEITKFFESFINLPLHEYEQLGLLYMNGEIVDHQQELFVLRGEELKNLLPLALAPLIGYGKIYQLNANKLQVWKQLLHLPNNVDLKRKNFHTKFFICTEQPSMLTLQHYIQCEIKKLVPNAAQQRTIGLELSSLIDTNMNLPIGETITSQHLIGLLSLVQSSTEPGKFIKYCSFNCTPTLNETFISRSEFDNARAFLNASTDVEKDSESQMMLNISGGHGVGKSRLLMELYNTIKKEDCNAIFFNVATKASMLDSLNNLLYNINIVNIRIKTIEACINLLIKVLPNNVLTYLFIDNITEATESYVKLLCTNIPTTCKIVSTSLAPVSSINFNIVNLQLQNLKNNEARALIQSLLMKLDILNAIDIDRLVQYTSGNAFFIIVCSNYIRKKNRLFNGLYSIKSFLEDIKGPGQILKTELFSRLTEMIDDPSGEIAKSELLNVLHKLCVMGPNMLPLDLLQIVFQNTHNINSLLDVLSHLKDLKLLVTTENHCLRVEGNKLLIQSFSKLENDKLFSMLEACILYIKEKEMIDDVLTNIITCLDTSIMTKENLTLLKSIVNSLLKNVHVCNYNKLTCLEALNSGLLTTEVENEDVDYFISQIELLYIKNKYKEAHDIIQSLQLKNNDAKNNKLVVTLEVLCLCKLKHLAEIINIYYTGSNKKMLVLNDYGLEDHYGCSIECVYLQIKNLAKSEKNILFHKQLLTDFELRIKQENICDISETLNILQVFSVERNEALPTATIINYYNELIKISISPEKCVQVKLKQIDFLTDVGQYNKALNMCTSMIPTFVSNTSKLVELLVVKAELECDLGRKNIAWSTYTQIMLAQGKTMSNVIQPESIWTLWALIDAERCKNNIV